MSVGRRMSHADRRTFCEAVHFAVIQPGHFMHGVNQGTGPNFLWPRPPPVRELRAGDQAGSAGLLLLLLLLQTTFVNPSTFAVIPSVSQAGCWDGVGGFGVAPLPPFSSGMWLVLLVAAIGALGGPGLREPPPVLPGAGVAAGAGVCVGCNASLWRPELFPKAGGTGTGGGRKEGARANEMLRC